MVGSFYRDPPELLSQGDIVSSLPWGLIEAPLTLCRADDKTKPHGGARYSIVEPWVMKGSPQPWQRRPEIIHATGSKGPGMVLWHGCEIEKAENQNRMHPEKSFVAIAPIHSLTLLEAGTPEKKEELHEAVKNGKHSAYFFLPAVTTAELALPDSFVNLRYIWSVRQGILQKPALSLHEDMLKSLYSQLFLFFTRFRIDVNPVCPRCGAEAAFVAAQEHEEP